MLKLREILQMPTFEGFYIVAGHNGIDREVSTVSVMDAPDIYEWMKGGEFLISSGYTVKDNPEYITSLIENLDKWGASAFGIKLGRFVEELPESAVKMAEELNFPIVYIPMEFAFTEVINPVLRELVNSQSREMMYSENVHKEFTRMALEDEEIPQILQTAEQYIQCDVGYLDTNLYQAYFSPQIRKENPLYQDLKSVESREIGLEAFLEKYEYYRLYINEEQYGYLFFGEKWLSYEESFENYYQIAIEQAGIIIIIKAQKMLAQRQVEENYREQFVQDLLRKNFKSQEEITNRARIYNWDFRAGGFVAIVDIDHFKQQYLQDLNQERNRYLGDMMNKICKICIRVLREHYDLAVYSRMSDQIIFIVSEPYVGREAVNAKCREVFEEVRREIWQKEQFTATIGVGAYRKDIFEINQSYEEAKKALHIVKERLEENILTIYDELGSLKLLSLVNKSDEATEFYDVYIRKLHEYDKKHETSLIPTMQTLVSCGWNLKETSDKLYIHYNSMKYRFQRICKILDMDFKDHEQRLDMEIALKLYYMNEREDGL